MSEGSVKIIEKTKEEFKVRTPNLVNILLLNNPATAHLGVLNILINVFKKDEKDAQEIMNRAEAEGKSTILKGLPRELAEIKVKQAYEYCKNQDKLNPTFNYLRMNFSIEENKGEE